MVGRTISHYRILDKLGEGGMGVVYKAEDTKLHRIVALKFIRPDAVENRELKARFLTEAESAAALNHPNICVVHEIDEADRQSFIAMEYVEGESLAEKIRKRPLPLDEALDISAQVAEGLHAAHRKGVVHRDIKPANIMINPEGQVKIMDFGLAHLEEATRITKSGMIIGTPVYMSPEQVRGEKLDHRADIWSLGVAIYEMIAGQLPFKGDIEQAVAAAIQNNEPEPLTALRSGIPVELDWVVAKALAKNPQERYQHIDELLVDLRGLGRKMHSGTAVARTTPIPTPHADQSTQSRRLRRGLLIYSVAITIALVVLAIATWLSAPGETREPPLRKFTLTPGADVSEPAISPDGRHLVYRMQGSLWVQDLVELAPRELEGTEGAGEPFWLPDSDFVAFQKGSTQEGWELQQVSITGGRPVFLCRLLPFPRRAALSPDQERIVFDTWARSGYPFRLAEVPVRGRTPALLKMSEEAGAELHLGAPHFIPTASHGHVLLFAKGTRERPQIVALNMDSGGETVLADGFWPVYCDSGHVIYQTSEFESGLWALPFSVKDLKRTGEPFSISPTGTRPSASLERTLVYLEGGERPPRQLVWRDRDGVKLAEIGQPQDEISQVIFSPDGRSVAVAGDERGNRDVWIHQVERPVKTRLTTFAGRDVMPVWSPAGDRLVFSSNREGNMDVFLVPADASTPETPLVATALDEWAGDWSVDGKYLLFERITPETQNDLWYLRFDNSGNHEEVPFLQTEFREQWARFSPDGRYVAYTSDESGRREVYVRQFPAGGGRYQVSSNGGSRPRWRNDGRELFYYDGGSIVAVPVSTVPNFQVAGSAKRLFEFDHFLNWDVSADGQRFVVSEAMGEAAPTVIRLVQNWFAEFRDP